MISENAKAGKFSVAVLFKVITQKQKEKERDLSHIGNLEQKRSAELVWVKVNSA